MSKNSKTTIREVIDYLLELRADLAYEEVDRQKKWSIERKQKYVSDILNTMDYIIGNFGDNLNDDLDLSRLVDIDDKLIKLNSLLSIEEKEPKVIYIEKQIIKVKEVIGLAEQQKKIQAKKIISAKEFTEIYGDSKKSQENYRGRLNHPLPYRQKVEGGEITYIVDEVEKWLENGHK